MKQIKMASSTQFNEWNKTIYQTLKFYKSNHTIGATFPQKKNTQNSCFFAMLFNFCLHFSSVFRIKTVDNQFSYCNLIIWTHKRLLHNNFRTCHHAILNAYRSLHRLYSADSSHFKMLFTAVEFSNCSNHKVLLRAFRSLADWFENYPNKCGNLLRITQILILNLIIVDLINWNLLKNTSINHTQTQFQSLKLNKDVAIYQRLHHPWLKWTLVRFQWRYFFYSFDIQSNWVFIVLSSY